MDRRPAPVLSRPHRPIRQIRGPVPTRVKEAEVHKLSGHSDGGGMHPSSSARQRCIQATGRRELPRPVDFSFAIWLPGEAFLSSTSIEICRADLLYFPGLVPCSSRTSGPSWEEGGTLGTGDLQGYCVYLSHGDRKTKRPSLLHCAPPRRQHRGWGGRCWAPT